MGIQKSTPTHKVLLIAIQIFVGDVDDDDFDDDKRLEDLVAKTLIESGMRDQLLDVHVLQGT